MRVSERGLVLIRTYERLVLDAYDDGTGVWTIGYGHTGPDVHEGDSWSVARAEAQLQCDVAVAEVEIEAVVEVALSQSFYDALVSFEFNTGGLRFVGRNGTLTDSRLLRAVNQSRWCDAIEELVTWNHAGGKELRGLLRRRLMEGLLACEEPWP